MTAPLRQQIETVELVLRLGEAGLRRAGVRSASEAELILVRLGAVRDTLARLARHEGVVRAAVASRKEAQA